MIIVPRLSIEYGFLNAVLIGIFTALVVKLIASWMQMMIGQCMRRSASIRTTVGLQTREMQATAMVLRREGLDVGKISIIIGGPDWPVSVLCGMLDLSPLPVLLWTIPVIVVIIPGVIS